MPPRSPRCLHQKLQPFDKEGCDPDSGSGKDMSEDYSPHLSARHRLWAQDTRSPQQNFTEMWYWVFLWCLFFSLLVHGATGMLMCVMLQRHRRGRLITVVIISVGCLASMTGSLITSAAVAGVYRVAGKNMTPLEALVLGLGQTTLTVIISFSRVLATL
ncbi:transmembrane protein 170B [Brachyhypopomus gauderio]|uniref:transmembrane protein 170B n=1 Tax=Brachyhypopomus gauderio TaxID=698409 RepID=UPI004042600B